MEPEGDPATRVSSAPNRTLRLRTRLPLYLLGLLIVLQLVQPDRAWAYPLAGLSVMVGLSYLWTRSLCGQVTVARQSRGAWAVVGDRLQERWVLHNRSPLPLLWATVQDNSTIPGYHIDRVVAAGGDGSFAWETEGVCLHRGIFTLGPYSLSLGDPMGLFEVAIDYPETRTLLVYPRAMHLPEIELPRGSAGGKAQRLRATHGETILASHVRPYVAGDSLRLIHWPKTAQQGQFMVRQFDLEPAGDLWLVLDLDASVQAGQGEESTLEYAVILAASLAAKHLGDNRAVGLAAFGREIALVPPRPTTAYLWPLLQVLARAETSDAWPLAQVLHQIGGQIGRGRTLLVITPSLATDWVGELLPIKRYDIAPAVLLLDAATFDDPPAPQPSPGLDALCALLADHAIPTHVIDKSFVFRPLIPIKRKRTLYKTLGTGRVIAVEVEEEV